MDDEDKAAFERLRLAVQIEKEGWGLGVYRGLGSIASPSKAGTSETSP